MLDIYMHSTPTKLLNVILPNPILVKTKMQKNIFFEFDFNPNQPHNWEAALMSV